MSRFFLQICFNPHDTKKVKKALIIWKLGRVITVVDRRFCSEVNLHVLQQTGRHYIEDE